ncbi:alpha-2-macroglobulin family protein, partial [Staphylococcus aureus]|uniref:alpha-2-macroglobulin family protein n=1 Tax=Staphylococcus aureus TaxID=1280 RepID=UPI0038B410DD
MQFSGAGGLRGGLVEQDSPIQSTSEPVTTVRTDFPDTWLFELYKVGDKGSLEMEQKMPDSITEWQG